jgi:hypothetical protein
MPNLYRDPIRTDLIWTHAARGYASIINGRRCVVVRRAGRAEFVPIEMLTDYEFENLATDAEIRAMHARQFAA